MDWPRLGDRFRALSPALLLLLLILAVALALRLHGIGWDQGFGFHPDERSIYMRSDCMFRVLTEAPGYAECVAEHPETEPGIPGPATFFDADKSPLNPHWFPLGNLLIYLIVAIRAVFEPFMDLGSLLSMAYIGRSIAAVADVGTVLMVYLLGKRVYGARVGLLGAALVALAVIHIQISHFYRPEPLLVFFLLVSFWFMLQVMERRRPRDSVLLGIFVGLTLAMKVSVLPLVLPLALAYGYWMFGSAGGGWKLPSSRHAAQVARHALLGAGAAIAVFAVTTPYAFLDIANFAGDIGYQAREVATKAGRVPFTVQYIDSTPFLYELRQTSLWGLGLPLGVVAWGGLLFTIVGVFRGGPFRRVASSLGFGFIYHYPVLDDVEDEGISPLAHVLELLGRVHQYLDSLWDCPKQPLEIGVAVQEGGLRVLDDDQVYVAILVGLAAGIGAEYDGAASSSRLQNRMEGASDIVQECYLFRHGSARVGDAGPRR